MDYKEKALGKKFFKFPLKLKIILMPVITLVFAAPLVIKIFYINDLISSQTGAKLLGATQVITNDSLIYFLILLFLYISFLSKTPFILSILMKALAFFVLCLYVIDLAIIINFNTHLTITDAVKYISYLDKYIQQIFSLKVLFTLLISFVAAVFAVLFLASKYKIKSYAMHIFFISTLPCLLLLILCFSNNYKYIHSWLYQNFITYNYIYLSHSKKYSDEFIKNFHYENRDFSYPKKQEKPNIVLLMVESLSSYQSKFFSGIKNWTPNIDSIAEKNIAFKKFYSNGFCTEDAFISLLMGYVPVAPPGFSETAGSSAFNKFYDYENSLPNILGKKGYSTEFFVTSDLSFANEGPWLKSLGFDYVEGSENPYYDKWERFQFKAAPDEALFNRVFDRIENKKNTSPYFIFICTVTSHHPYINPETKNRSESETFQYVDKQIGKFYKNLISSGFFDNGILIIVGDHHAMIPLKEEEVKRFGFKAIAQIPMVISYGDKKHSVIDEQYQQVDIYNGLKNLISDILHYSDWRGDIFAQKSPKYIAYKRGDQREIISVFSKDEDYFVKLDGDDTRIVKGNPTDLQAKDIIKKINALRIETKK